MLHFDPFYQDYERTLAAFQLAHSTIYFEQSTFAPKKGIPYSNEMLSRLSKQAFQIENDPQTYEKIKNYYNQLEDGTIEKLEVKKRLTQLERTKNIPSDVYARFVKVKADAELAWHEAKEMSDYEHFKPYFKELMKETLHLVEYNPKFDGTNAYNVLLDKYESGTSQEMYDAFFKKVKDKLVPLIHEIQKQPQIDDSILHKTYDIKRQEKFMNEILTFLNYDPTRTYLETTEHPFTHGLSSNDLRITTHYYENEVTKAPISTIHEFGHALYSLQMNPEFEGTLLNHCGAAAQESQSRFLENYIGRGKTFWKTMYPKFIEIFPEFKETAFEDFYRMLNKVECSLVRTKADELTYPLHIMIRYEIEKDIANKKVDYDTLPQVWADKYEEYLGVRPDNDKDGILQDMHWSSDFYAYFPTYALGSAYAAQLYATMEKQIDVDQAIQNHQFEIISNWLKENVHQYADTKSMAQIVEEVSGEPFNPDYYIDYLTKKYKEIYNL